MKNFPSKITSSFLWRKTNHATPPRPPPPTFKQKSQAHQSSDKLEQSKEERAEIVVLMDCSWPENIEWFIEDQAFSQSFYSATSFSLSFTSISTTSETEKERQLACGRRGQGDDRKKAWPSINHSILSARACTPLPGWRPVCGVAGSVRGFQPGDTLLSPTAWIYLNMLTSFSNNVNHTRVSTERIFLMALFLA